MRLAAVIVETRVGDKYVDVIKQHMKHLKGWDLVIVTPEDNHPFYTQHLPEAYLFNCYNVNDYNDYNNMLTSQSFWCQFLYYDRVLIFQHDSMILRNNIDDFLGYDYVGSPWTFQDHGGNGGLSLRTPLLMAAICEFFPYSPNLGNEDVYFCNIMYEKNYGNLAPREMCAAFSMEVIYEEGTFGCHAIEKYHDEETINKIKSQEEL